MQYYTFATPDIQWQIHLRAWARDPVNPKVLAEGVHDGFPAYEIICLQSDGTFTDVDRFLPDANSVPGPSTLLDVFSVSVNKNKSLQ